MSEGLTYQEAFELLDVVFYDEDYINMIIDKCNSDVDIFSFIVDKCTTDKEYSVLSKICESNNYRLEQDVLVKVFNDGSVSDFEDILKYCDFGPYFEIDVLSDYGPIIYYFIENCENDENIEMIKKFVEMYPKVVKVVKGENEDSILSDYISFSYINGNLKLVDFFIEKGMFEKDVLYDHHKDAKLNLFNFVLFNNLKNIEDVLSHLIKNLNIFYTVKKENEALLFNSDYVYTFLLNCFYNYKKNNYKNNTNKYLSVITKIINFENTLGINTFTENYISSDVFYEIVNFLNKYIKSDIVSYKILSYLAKKCKFDIMTGKLKNDKTIFEKFEFSELKKKFENIEPDKKIVKV